MKKSELNAFLTGESLSFVEDKPKKGKKAKKANEQATFGEEVAIETAEPITEEVTEITEEVEEVTPEITEEPIAEITEEPTPEITAETAIETAEPIAEITETAEPITEEVPDHIAECAEMLVETAVAVLEDLFEETEEQPPEVDAFSSCLGSALSRSFSLQVPAQIIRLLDFGDEVSKIFKIKAWNGTEGTARIHRERKQFTSFLYFFRDNGFHGGKIGWAVNDEGTELTLVLYPDGTPYPEKAERRQQRERSVSKTQELLTAILEKLSNIETALTAEKASLTSI